MHCFTNQFGILEGSEKKKSRNDKDKGKVFQLDCALWAVPVSLNLAEV